MSPNLLYVHKLETAKNPRHREPWVFSCLDHGLGDRRLQRLLQIPDNIHNRLRPDRQTNQTRGHSGSGLFFIV